MHSRRQFLQTTGLVSLGAAPPAFLAKAAQSAGGERDQRILVVLQLAGGNDGLNTVVPFADDLYHDARPGIKIAPGAVRKINDHLGLHPAMSGLQELHDEGALAIVQGVGYPDPNRSHFRSMDIWNSAQPEVEIPDDGWLGRALDQDTGSPDGAVPALALGTGRLPLALVSRKINVPTVRDLSTYRLAPGAGSAGVRAARLRAIASLAARPAAEGSELAYLRRTTSYALRSAQRIEKAATSYQPAAPYPNNSLGRKLKTVAQLITGDLGTRIFFVSLGGFDTHSQQGGAHAALLAELSGAVHAFFKDLGGHKLADRVLLATYSEFGRRVKENGSLGTDHGTASPLFLASPALKKPGLVGTHPDISDLDGNGDLKFGTDFRTVYSTLLEGWLGIDSKPVLGRRFDKLDVI